VAWVEVENGGDVGTHLPPVPLAVEAVGVVEVLVKTWRFFNRGTPSRTSGQAPPSD